MPLHALAINVKNKWLKQNKKKLFNVFFRAQVGTHWSYISAHYNKILITYFTANYLRSYNNPWDAKRNSVRAKSRGAIY